jgi:hypothetical protein
MPGRLPGELMFVHELIPQAGLPWRYVGNI